MHCWTKTTGVIVLYLIAINSSTLHVNGQLPGVVLYVSACHWFHRNTTLSIIQSLHWLLLYYITIKTVIILYFIVYICNISKYPSVVHFNVYFYVLVRKCIALSPSVHRGGMVRNVHSIPLYVYMWSIDNKADFDFLQRVNYSDSLAESCSYIDNRHVIFAKL